MNGHLRESACTQPGTLAWNEFMSKIVHQTTFLAGYLEKTDEGSVYKTTWRCEGCYGSWLECPPRACAFKFIPHSETVRWGILNLTAVFRGGPIR
jgi:hypothetical protein